MNSTTIDGFTPQNLADTCARSHLYVNNVNKIVNKMLTKVVMFDILEYFLAFVVRPYSLVKFVSSVVFLCTVAVMVYTGECRPLYDKGAVVEGTIKEIQCRPIHVIVDRTYTRMKTSVSRQYLFTVQM
jgi:hypothetical protein